jgi:hypothetical protein
MTVEQRPQRVGEVADQIDVAHLAVHDQAVEQCTILCADLVPGKEGVFRGREIFLIWFSTVIVSSSRLPSSRNRVRLGHRAKMWRISSANRAERLSLQMAVPRERQPNDHSAAPGRKISAIPLRPSERPSWITASMLWAQ